MKPGDINTHTHTLHDEKECHTMYIVHEEDVRKKMNSLDKYICTES